MAELGISGVTRARAPRTTVASEAAERPRDLVDRNFAASRPNQLWVADFTYVPTWDGTVYVAFVVDVFSRMIVGWRAATKMTTPLVLDALEMALWSRRKHGVTDLSGLVHHTDAGSQGGFKWSSQHLECGGVRWDDHPVGRQRGREGQRCGRRGGRGSISGRSSRRSGSGSPRVCRVRTPRRCAACRSRSGRGWFRDAGGMPPISLAGCSGRYLSFAEREEIALLRAQRFGVCEIARRLGRSASTISRELRRNAATRGGKLEYRATVAQWKAERAARRPKTAKLADNDRLRQYVQDRLAGTIKHPDGTEVAGPACRLEGAGTAAARTGAGPQRGARSRSPTGCGSTSPMMSPCGSRTRPSTRRSTSRAAARYDASSPLPAHRPRAAGAPRADPRAGQEVRHRRSHDQRTSGRGRGSRGARALGISMLLSSRLSCLRWRCAPGAVVA